MTATNTELESEMLDTYRVPLITAVGMIVIPFILRFIETAGYGSLVNGLASFSGLIWSTFGVVSVGLGVVSLLVIAAMAFFGGQKSQEMNG